MAGRIWKALAMALLMALVLPGSPAEARKVIPGLIGPVKAEDVPLTFVDEEADARCRAGAAEACVELGLLYLEGEQVFRNLRVARILFRDACELGNQDGCAGFAMTDRQSHEPWTAAETPEAILRRTCDAGSLLGCEGLAYVLLEQTGTPASSGATLALAQDACARGRVTMCLMVEQWLRERTMTDEEKAASDARILSLCLDKGNYQACSDAYYIVSAGTDRDEALVSRVNEKACEAGDSSGCMREAERLARGLEVSRDPERAATLVDRACALEESLCHSAENYRTERRVRPLCAAGDAEACGVLGALLYDNRSLAMDSEEGLRLSLEACRSGARDACSLAATQFAYPWPEPGTPRAEEAILIFERACYEEKPSGCGFYAQALRDGDLIAPDIERAALLFARACAAGDEQSCKSAQEFAGIEPEVELADADDVFSPPLEPDEDDRQPLTRSKGPKHAMYADCEHSRLMFRGTIYIEIRCGTVIRGVQSYTLRPGQAPWQALLWRPAVVGGQRASLAGRVLCGGSVVARGWILTAAHCLTEIGSTRITPGYKVRLGVYNPRAEEGVSYPIIRTISHPSFNPRNYAFDIGLVRYDYTKPSKDGPVQAIKTVKLDPLPIGERAIEETMNVYGYGWGWTEATGSSTTDNLRGFKMQLKTEAECTRITNFRGDRLNSSLCAGGADGAQACLGDSGGPLIYYGDEDRVPRVIGVISAGKKCGTLGEVSRYTRVAKVRAWIAEQMRRYSAD